MGEVFRAELARLAEKHPSIGEVRGLGCFWGLELVKNRETREPLVPFNGAGEAAKPMAAVMKRALDRGLYLMTHWNVVMCCPPLTITREELDEALDDPRRRALRRRRVRPLRAFAEAPDAYLPPPAARWSSTTRASSCRCRPTATHADVCRIRTDDVATVLAEVRALAPRARIDLDLRRRDARAGAARARLPRPGSRR